MMFPMVSLKFKPLHRELYMTCSAAPTARSLVALLLTISIPIRSPSPPIYVEDLQGRRYMDFYGNSCRQPSSDLAVLPSAVF